MAPSLGTSDVPVLEADCPPTETDVAFCFQALAKALGPQTLCGGASSSWLPSVGSRLLSCLSSSSEWPEAKLASREVSELQGFSVAADPSTTPSAGGIWCCTEWGKVVGIMASSLLVSELLAESSRSLTLLSSFSAFCILVKLLCSKSRAWALSGWEVPKFTPYSTITANRYWGQYWSLLTLERHILS